MFHTRTCSSASETASLVQRAKQDPGFREQLLRWEKRASECDRSLFGNGGSGAVCDRSFIDLFDPEWGRFLGSNPYLLGSVNYKQAVSVGAKV
ncbi:hypothetical protein [Microcoleus sp. S13C4]|uniref:hypothetical protein n=1 Tax=Microcoleus sp. S13C4 TaxID=3055410 RepID=UPI002FD4C696